MGANFENLKKALRQLRAPLQNQRGVALLMALFSATVMLIIAVELTYETNVDYQVSAQQLNRLKSFYAARGGVELALLRIKIYQGLSAQLKNANPLIKQMIPMNIVDTIWQMPFVWPPPVPDSISAVDKDNIRKSVEESLMEAQYVVRISALSGKLDFNDLASPSKSLAKSVREKILQILRNKIEFDEDFSRKYRSYRFEELLNNITDYIDADNESLNGGDERNYYRELNSSVRYMPPNQPFRTPEELHMVANMTDDLYDVFMRIGSVFGIKGININYSNEEQLQGLHPRLTLEIAKEIIQRRTRPGPFQSQEEFVAYLNSKGLDTRFLESADSVPLYFDPEQIFEISSTGTFGKSAREIVAIVYDFDRVKENLVKAIAKDKPNDDGTKRPDSAGPKSDDKKSDDKTKDSSQAGQSSRRSGRPTIVYWKED